MKTVFVGLSGGVDSAVSAYLLKKQGYRVVGAFIRGWEPDFLPCTGAEDRLSAMRVAAHLEIPFVMYDLENEYKKEVVDYFVSEYKMGRTPNPDVVCNRAIKFGAFWEKAKADGADCIATGHYAINSARTGHFDLEVSEDTEKDQTYFLWTLTQADLVHSLFPVGAMKKNEVRNIARDALLPNALRKDSQGLCFLGHVDMKAFLKRYIPSREGVVRSESGEQIGVHEGVWFYTLGQHLDLGGLTERRYVVKKDPVKNELTVSATPLGESTTRSFEVSNVNWISDIAGEVKILGRYRYRGPLLAATVKCAKPGFRTGKCEVQFEDAQLIAPGQSVVFYDELGRTCLGGAVVG
jgi:tRNA-specific 2-thiouridylase